MAGRAPGPRPPAHARAGRRAPRFVIVAARFHEPITKRLVDGALAAFAEAGVDAAAVDVLWVPGSFELPQAAGLLAGTRRYAGIVGVGVVIRGETPHFEHVAREAAAGLRHVALASGLPVGFGVVTAFDEAQAWARAGGEVGNRGEEAARAVIEMAEFARRTAGPHAAPGARRARAAGGGRG